MTLPSPRNQSSSTMTSRDVMLGTLWGLMAAFCHSFIPIAVRLLHHMPPIELVFFRNIIGLVLFLLIVFWHGFGFVQTRRFGFHFQRCFLNFTGMWLWFAGLALLPIAKAVALHFTIPLMVVPLAMILLRERPGLGRLICTVIGFGGVLVILRPGAVPVDFSVFLVLGSALSYAGVSIYTRVLGGTDSPTTTTFYYHALLSIFAPLSMAIGWAVAAHIPAMGLSPEAFRWITPDWKDAPALLLLAVSGGLAPYCLVRAFVHAEATIVQPVEYLRLPITALFAYLVFGQTTDRWVWIGAAIIAGSTYYMARHESRARI
ncbi:MAG: DMT family transporter [Proteobacteria bacterium]|nr:DMT family transporter [Pseudomonadota bacterium]